MTRIVYLHGFASGPSSGKARYLRDYLTARGADITIPDLAEGDFDSLTITGQLAVLDRAVAGQPAALIGSSMGGYLAALYAARHPQITRLVLLAPALGFVRRWSGNVPTQVFHFAEARMRNFPHRLVDDALQYEDAPDFRQPALIFHGSRDPVVPAAWSQEFAATHSNATLEVLDSGHELTDVLDYMAPKIAAFLSH